MLRSGRKLTGVSVGLFEVEMGWNWVGETTWDAHSPYVCVWFREGKLERVDGCWIGSEDWGWDWLVEAWE